MSIFSAFRKTREQQKQEAINSMLISLNNETFNFKPVEVTEILNRVRLNVMQSKKDTMKKLIEEAREYKNSINDLNI